MNSSVAMTVRREYLLADSFSQIMALAGFIAQYVNESTKKKKKTWCLLHGEKDMPMFDVQMKTFARAIREHRPQDTVITRTLKGKGHTKMATDLGSPRHDTISPIFTKEFGILPRKFI